VNFTDNLDSCHVDCNDVCVHVYACNAGLNVIVEFDYFRDELFCIKLNLSVLIFSLIGSLNQF
jgi:hypothetical protein